MQNRINFNPSTYIPGTTPYSTPNSMSSPYFGDFNCNYGSGYNYGENFKGDMYGLVKKHTPSFSLTGTDFYGIEAYNKLSEAEKIALRLNISNPEQINEVLHLTDIIENNLKQKYPNRFKIVGIGRSPSLIIELLKAKGIDATSCPLSNLTNGEYDISGKYSYLKQLNSSDITNYKEFLEEAGITAENLQNNGKTTIFVDYTRTGNSLKSFEDLLARKEIGINKKHNIVFLSLNKDLIPDKSYADLALIDKYWENLGIKKYSFMPKLDISDIGKVKEIMKNFKPSEETCKFLLQAIDVMKTSGKI